MTETTQETIFSLSSAPGRAGVAVVRVSGPDAEKCASLMKGDLPDPRRARVRTLFDNKTNDRIDVALIVYFPAPKSFTGENIVEIQCHGGRAVVESVLELLAVSI